MSNIEVLERIEIYAGRSDELIQALQLVQDELGYVSEEMQRHVANTLGLSIGVVHGVITFYHLFRERPGGQHTIRLCLGTACHVLGADRILAALQEQLSISVGGTTEDGTFSLDVVRCLGACSLAPVMMIGDDVHGRLTPESVFEILETYQKKESG